MNVMGLDLSTKTGLAVVEMEHPVHPQVSSVPTMKPKIILAVEIEFPKTSGLDRAYNFAEYILERYNEYKPHVIFIEGYGYANSHTLGTLVELGTVIKYTLWQHGIGYYDIPPNSLKKFVTGVGNAPKDSMMMWVMKRWKFESKTNNICDAVGLAMMAACSVDPTHFTASQLGCVHATMKSQT